MRRDRAQDAIEYHHPELVARLDHVYAVTFRVEPDSLPDQLLRGFRSLRGRLWIRLHRVLHVRFDRMRASFFL